MKTKKSQIKRARLSLAIAAVLFLPSVAAVAGNLGGGQSHTVQPVDPSESWALSDGASLTLAPGAMSLDIDATGSTVLINDQGRVEASGVAMTLANGSVATLTGATIVSTDNRGIVLANRFGSTLRSSLDVTGGSISGATYGASVGSAATMTLHGVTMTGTGVDGVGAVIFNGDATIADGSTVTGETYGLRIRKDERGSVGLPSGRTLILDGSKIEGLAGSGIIVDNMRGQPTDGVVSIVNGSEVVGGNGVAIELAADTTADVTVDRSAIRGDLLVADSASATLRLQNGANMTGSMNGAIAATLADDALWNMTADSTVNSLDLSGGGVAIASPSGGAPHFALTVRGDLSGSGGTIGLNTTLNEGGALSAQATNRLLIEGNVTTSAPVVLAVTPTGAGAATDANQNGSVEANEGISLVQVGGSSRANAFALRGGYVAAGPWQYTLHAFGPGQADQAQNALATGSLNWDYRLGSRMVCQTDCDPVDPTRPVDPGDPGNPENPGDPGNPVNPVLPPDNGRVAVVPQLPSYLSAPAALLTYGDMMNDGLHQRLGDLRNGSSHDPVGGEVFARYLGGQLRYTSNLSFQRYGYDFDQQVNALQVGGSLIALDGDNGTLRAGWAADHGTTRVTPKAADGNSSAKYNANGMSAWMTWQHGGGLWVDGVLGSTRYRGDVGTDLRGGDVGTVRANGWIMSVETGMPFALGNEWTVEPRFQLKHQSLNFRDFTDGDGLDVRLGTAKQTSATVGARLMRTANPVFMPYANLDLTHTSNGDPSADVSSADWGLADRFGSGRVGNAYKVAAGAISQLGEHVQVFGEGKYQHFVGSYGMRGWAGNVGVRVTF
jgi:outer membrane autotransporter protein